MTTENKTSVFSWSANNNEAAVKAESMYLQAITEHGLAAANGDATMAAIAETVGAKSGRAVRQKLASAGVYRKDENAHTGARSTRVTRKALVTLAEKATGLKLDSLEGCNKDELAGLVDWLNKATANKPE